MMSAAAAAAASAIASWRGPLWCTCRLLHMVVLDLFLHALSASLPTYRIDCDSCSIDACCAHMPGLADCLLVHMPCIVS